MRKTKFEDKTVYVNTFEDEYCDKLNPSYIYCRNEITYLNPVSKKKQTMTYLHMNDLIVPIILKKDDNNITYFAMQYTYIPARNKIFLELPAFSIYRSEDENDNQDTIYSTKDITHSINNFLSEIDYKKISYSKLTSNFEPVSQSITDQLAKFIEIKVEYNNKTEALQWFPISCLMDLLKRNDLNMSMQTKYGLTLFKEKHKKELLSLSQTQFKEDTKLLNKVFNKKHRYEKKIYQIYRLGLIEKVRIDTKVIDLYNKQKIECFGNKAIFATSKDSAQSIVTKVENKKIKVGLSKQQRSPFIARPNIDEYFYEVPAGLVEDGEQFEIAVKREVSEETGIQINGTLKKLTNRLLISYATEELSEMYFSQLEDNYVQTKQKLDEQENITEIEWFDLKTLDIDKLNSPISTKLALIMVKELYNL